MQKVKLTAQLFNLRDMLRDKSRDEIFDVLKAVRTMGYEAVQISAVGDITPELARVYRDVCGELGLEIALSHANFAWLSERLDWVVEYHRMWNCRHIGVGSMPPEYRGDEEGYRRFIRECNAAAARLAAEDCVLFYHNHQFEFERRGERTGMDMLFLGLDRRVELFLIPAGCRWGEPARLSGLISVRPACTRCILRT